MKKLLILNGPNLNLIGVRERGIYGSRSFDAFLSELRALYGTRIEFDYVQSNIEGELINELHRAATERSADGVILNAGGYTHTSVSLADAVSAVANLGLPTIEVHISNIASREAFRHTSLLTPRCRGAIMGFGLDSYRLAVEYFLMETVTDPEILPGEAYALSANPSDR